MNIPLMYHNYSVRKIMFLVIIACIPGIFTKCYFFGSGTLIQILLFIIISLILETIILKIRRKKIKINLQDNSSVLTSVLLGVSVPSSLPWWIIIIAVFFSIIVAKHLYGGIGQNIFNPAMVGYAVLLVSFPIQMNYWHERDFSLSFLNDVKKSIHIIFSKNYMYKNDLNSCPDAFTEATPLNNFKIKSHFKNNDIVSRDNVFTNKEINLQSSWIYINISFFLGGLLLFLKKIICWRIPISFLISLGFFSTITYFYSQELFMSPLIHLFSGGTMICAFFIATDPVTTSCTNIGKIIFGIIIGFLVWIIRNYTDYPDSIAFSVLFANMTVPLIDYYIKTSGYGHNNT
ncbi:RnfABCDGE type electron transport complex subunit D [Buchnera aphidicola (Hyperomyzus lactucae)]|uniref:Ion-translocating oxidoreductase complex subunit D n=1 Tax=Buchnera aphidicola (Hyperomyzus lactucae) TaxID=1241860 RepID=A0A4D6Y980_9GAMM|nr:RnfABCDGE type electron transport complex subunit D [Buchnera aphidicola]QCI20855.1 RnfABCDGE type electron transport complex subunit D [Buchnera aphidicola (Hyperomyzus lactucae)]